MKTLAKSFGSITLVGYHIQNYPSKDGNCFSVKLFDDSETRVVNFNYENLEELIKRNIVSFPITIEVLGDEHCKISDDRIPKEWYMEEYCQICTPTRFFSEEQLKIHKNKLECVKISNIDMSDWKMETLPPIIAIGTLDLETHLQEEMDKLTKNSKWVPAPREELFEVEDGSELHKKLKELGYAEIYKENI